MKKSILILTIFSICLNFKISAQNKKLTFAEWEKAGVKLLKYEFNFHAGVMSGFEIFNAENANSTNTTPIGFNYVDYKKSNPFRYFRYSFDYVPIIVSDQVFTSFFNATISHGWITEKATWDLGVDYYRSALRFKDLVGLTLRASKNPFLPVQLKYFYSHRLNSHYILMGIFMNLNILDSKNQNPFSRFR